MAHDEEDRARLLAALTMAIRSGAIDADTEAEFEERLARLGAAMRGRHWQITVARDLRIGPAAWFDRPWHCWKLRQLVRDLLAGTVPQRDEQASMALLTRCGAMIEFGVDVNAAWYRRLREAVVSGRATQAELRSLLRRATVWWGTAVAPRGGRWHAVALLARLWRMGRPADGELLVAEHHRATKALLVALMTLSGFALGFVLVALGRSLAVGAPAIDLAKLIVASYTYAILLWASWWFGPHSWSAVNQLRDVLQLPPTRR